VEELDYYHGREQSLIKHEILRKYLQRLTYKVVLGLKTSIYPYLHRWILRSLAITLRNFLRHFISDST
jgi:hypothetical protein